MGQMTLKPTVGGERQVVAVPQDRSRAKQGDPRAGTKCLSHSPPRTGPAVPHVIATELDPVPCP